MVEESGEILIITTVSSMEQAEVLCRAMLEERLAACATALPGALSFYRWKSDSVNCDPEVLILLKSHQSKLTELRELFARSHPYECPEFLAFSVAHIADPYRKWLRSELRIEGAQ